MADGFLGEIRMFAGNYAPAYWAKCDGQLLSADQNVGLCHLIKNTYGGQGNFFNLPDMRGRVPIHQGIGMNKDGTPLSPRPIGQSGGRETIALTDVTQMPPHNHPMVSANTTPDSTSPSNSLIATSPSAKIYDTNASPDKIKTLDTRAVSFQGNSQSHNNLAPSLCITFIICLNGVMPRFDN